MVDRRRGGNDADGMDLYPGLREWTDTSGTPRDIEGERKRKFSEV